MFFFYLFPPACTFQFHASGVFVMYSVESKIFDALFQFCSALLACFFRNVKPQRIMLVSKWEESGADQK